MPGQSRAYGYGTIYQRASDNRWIAAVELPRARGAARKRKVFAGASCAEVEAKLEEYRRTTPAEQHYGRAFNMDQARAQGSHTTAEWWALVRSVACRCLYCRKDAFWSLEKDHKIPVSRGGSDAIDNIAVCCAACNAEKGTMTADEYLAWKADR